MGPALVQSLLQYRHLGHDSQRRASGGVGELCTVTLVVDGAVLVRDVRIGTTNVALLVADNTKL